MRRRVHGVEHAGREVRHVVRAVLAAKLGGRRLRSVDVREHRARDRRRDAPGRPCLLRRRDGAGRAGGGG